MVPFSINFWSPTCTSCVSTLSCVYSRSANLSHVVYPTEAMLFQVSHGVLLQVTGSCGHQEAPGVMTVQRGAGRRSSLSRPPGKQFLRTVFGTDEGRAVLYCNSRVFQRTKESLGECCRSARFLWKRIECPSFASNRNRVVFLTCVVDKQIERVFSS
jgi:hypothetical protein